MCVCTIVENQTITTLILFEDTHPIWPVKAFFTIFCDKQEMVSQPQHSWQTWNKYHIIYAVPTAKDMTFWSWLDRIFLCTCTHSGMQQPETTTKDYFHAPWLYQWPQLCPHYSLTTKCSKGRCWNVVHCNMLSVWGVHVLPRNNWWSWTSGDLPDPVSHAKKQKLGTLQRRERSETLLRR